MLGNLAIMISFLSFAISAQSYAAETNSVIGELEQICDLADEDLAALTEIIDEKDKKLATYHGHYTELIEKLKNCKSNLERAYRNCTTLHKHIHYEHLKAKLQPAKNNSDTWSLFVSGCDLVIKTASVLWALQLIYGYLF